MLKNKKIGFIGGGNMAEAIIKGLITSRFIEAKNITVSDTTQMRLNFLQKKHKVLITSDNRKTTAKSDIVIIAVKPETVSKVLNEVGDLADNKKLFVSVAAGIHICHMEKSLIGNRGKKVGVVRTMPNTPSLVMEGVTAISHGTHVSKKELQIVHRIFEAIGKTVEVEENQLDAVTGLSGSGPAYILMVIEALSDAGVKMGLPREVSKTLTVQTILGTAKLALESDKHLSELKDMITSPGGTTIAGLHTLEASGIRASFINAVETATRRSVELGRTVDKNMAGESSSDK